MISFVDIVQYGNCPEVFTISDKHILCVSTIIESNLRHVFTVFRDGRTTYSTFHLHLEWTVDIDGCGIQIPSECEDVIKLIFRDVTSKDLGFVFNSVVVTESEPKLVMGCWKYDNDYQDASAFLPFYNKDGTCSRVSAFAAFAINIDTFVNIRPLPPTRAMSPVEEKDDGIAERSKRRRVN